jgi:hypothetical protein
MCLPKPTYQLTNLPAYQLTSLPTYQLTNLPTCQLTNLPTYQLTNLPAYHLATSHFSVFGKLKNTKNLVPSTLVRSSLSFL